ncbi:MAG: cysteine--tRNA ligase, partial [Thermoleophilia bacterium]|nr:cysteine--tRNA ligase [Thermoleophilia bacterium]
AAGTSPRALRYALLSAHYRAPLEFSDASLVAATAAVDRLSTLMTALAAYREERPADGTLAALLVGTRTAFEAAMDDDLSISPALAAVFDLVRELNRRLAERSLSTADAASAAATLRDLDRVLGVLEDDPPVASSEVQALLAARAAARAARDWPRSDALRVELAAAGIVVEDTRDGQRWHPSGGDDGAA